MPAVDRKCRGNTVATDGVAVQVKGSEASNWAPEPAPCGWNPRPHSSIQLSMKTIRSGGDLGH